MELQQGYTHLANLLAPYVDVLLCETLASAREGAIAARAAAATGVCGFVMCMYCMVIAGIGM